MGLRVSASICRAPGPGPAALQPLQAEWQQGCGTEWAPAWDPVADSCVLLWGSMTPPLPC